MYKDQLCGEQDLYEKQDNQANGILSVASETKFNSNIMPRYKLISNKSAVANMTTLVEDARNRDN